MHTVGLVSEYFTIEGHALATRTADAYRAIDKSRSQSVCLWMLKHPLSLNSDTVKRFLSRIEAIGRIAPGITGMSGYGVDAEGTAFAVLAPLDGQSLLGGGARVEELERRFLECVHLVEQIHNSREVCGDLCPSSFWLNRRGDLELIGIMGSFDAEAAATAMLPPLETLPFMAPEQRGGGMLEPATDVFALGVLGYRLLTGRFPYGEGLELLALQLQVENVPPLGESMAQPPVWGAEVLTRALHPDPAVRYQSAGEMLADVRARRREQANQEQLPMHVQVGSAVVVSPNATAEKSLVRRSSGRLASRETAKRLLLVVLIAVLVVLVLSGRRIAHKLGQGSPKITESAAELDHGGNPEIDGALSIIRTKGTSQPQKAREIEVLGESDDPLAHFALIKIAREDPSIEIRELAQKALLDRAHRSGLIRSAAQVRQWLRTSGGQADTAVFEAILQLLNSGVPMSEREVLLRRAYRADPAFVLRLATAQAFDNNDLEGYQTVLVQLLGDAMGLEDAEQHSALALIMAYQPLALVFGDEIVQNRQELRSSDVLWVLKILGERNDINTRAVANLALERNLLKGPRRIFVQTIRDRSGLPTDVAAVLIKAASGGLKVNDLNNLGRWIDMDAERLLLAVMAEVSDPQLLTEAFDLVAAKSMVIQPSAAMVDWVRRNYWQRRAEFAHAIGVFAFLDDFEVEEIEVVFSSFDQFVRDSALIRLLLSTGNATIIKLVLRKYPSLIELGDKLSLLRHEDRDLRRLAIYAVQSEGDLGALKLIVDAYNAERDPELRELYRKLFWHLRNRR